MQFKIGMVVKSNAGHDKNSFYVLVDVDIDKQIGFIADGKRRKLEKPKCKNLIHLSKTNSVLENAAWETNLKIRRVLASFNHEQTASVAE